MVWTRPLYLANTSKDHLHVEQLHRTSFDRWRMILDVQKGKSISLEWCWVKDKAKRDKRVLDGQYPGQGRGETRRRRAYHTIGNSHRQAGLGELKISGENNWENSPHGLHQMAITSLEAAHMIASTLQWVRVVGWGLCVAVLGGTGCIVSLQGKDQVDCHEETLRQVMFHSTDRTRKTMGLPETKDHFHGKALVLHSYPWIHRRIVSQKESKVTSVSIRLVRLP